MEFLVEEGRIYHQDERNTVLAEVTYCPVRAGVVDVDHTYVDPSLRGQGVAGRLMEALVLPVRVGAAVSERLRVSEHGRPVERDGVGVGGAGRCGGVRHGEGRGGSGVASGPTRRSQFLTSRS